jgi:cytoskeletal protein CcmA (bactofilin family)
MAESRDITIIGTNAKFKGELVIEGTGQIYGQFDGNIDAKGDIQIGESAVLQATVEGDRLIVEGTVKGDLLAREKLQLTETSNVTGDITAAALVVAEGASFIGRVSVGPQAIANAQSKPKTAVEPKAGRNGVGGEWNSETNSRDWVSTHSAA